MENKVLAKVGSKEITQNDVNELLKSVGPEKYLQFASPQGQKQLLEELISQELILQNAILEKLDETEEYQREILKARESILKQLALRKLLSAVKITPEDARNYYDENLESFRQQESWKASHILVDTEEEAISIYTEIQNGKTFGQAALEYSKCPSKQRQGDLGFFTAGKMVKEFEDSVKGMAVGDIEKCVPTQFGFHLIQLTDKKEEKITPFEEIKEELQKQLTLIHQEKAYIETAEALKEEIPVTYI